MTEQTNEQGNNEISQTQNNQDVEITSQSLSDDELFGEQGNDNLDDTENNDEESQESEPEEEQSEQKPKNKVQARIDEITREKKQAQEELARARAELEAIKQANKPVLKEPIEPDELDFDDTNSYKQAKDAYKQELKEFVKQQALQEIESQKQLQPKVDACKATFDEVNKINPQFKSSLQEMDKLGAVDSVELQQALIDSEHGAFILNELAKDPQKGAEITKLAHSDISKFNREIGKIEARLSLEKSKSTIGLGKKQNPKPIAPVGSNGTAEKSFAQIANSRSDSQSIDDYIKMRRKQGAKVF